MLHLIVLIVTRFVCVASLFGGFATVISGDSWIVVSCDWVLRRFFFTLFICPLAVVTDFGRCFLINFVVRPGNLTKYPVLMASHHVVSTGLQHERWWYFARSGFVRSEWTFAASFWILLLCSLLAIGVIGVNQSPDGVCLFPSRTTFCVSGSITFALSFVNHASYPESQNWPTEYSDLYLSPG